MRRRYALIHQSDLWEVQLVLGSNIIRLMVIRVLLVDDHELVRQGIAAMLAKAEDLQIVGEARTGREAVEYARRPV